MASAYPFFLAMPASCVNSRVRLPCSISCSTYRPIALLVHARQLKAPLKVASQSGIEKKCDRPRDSTHTMVSFDPVAMEKVIDMAGLWISETRSFMVVTECGLQERRS